MSGAMPPLQAALPRPIYAGEVPVRPRWPWTAVLRVNATKLIRQGAHRSGEIRAQAAANAVLGILGGLIDSDNQLCYRSFRR
jgi:hypothetical protein